MKTAAFRRAVIAAVGLLVATAATTAMAEPVNIRFGYSNFPSQLAAGIYQVPEGVLKHYGKSYTIDLQQVSASSAQTTALAAGRIDVAMFSPTALVLAAKNAGLDMRIIADGIQDGVGDYRSQTLHVKANAPIQTVQDLKGKTIGVNGLGSASHTAIVAMLRRSGLSERDVQFVEVSFANQLPMIEDGKIDATTIQMPMGNMLVRDGKYRALFTSGQALGVTQFNFIASTEKFLAANREVMKDFVEDYMRAFKWYTDPKNHDASIALAAKIAKRPAADLTYLFTQDDYYRDPDLVPSVAGIQTTIDFANEIGMLNQKIDVDPVYVDLSLVEEAKRRIAANP